MHSDWIRPSCESGFWEELGPWYCDGSPHTSGQAIGVRSTLVGLEDVNIVPLTAKSWPDGSTGRSLPQSPLLRMPRSPPPPPRPLPLTLPTRPLMMPRRWPVSPRPKRLAELQLRTPSGPFRPESSWRRLPVPAPANRLLRVPLAAQFPASPERQPGPSRPLAPTLRISAPLTKMRDAPPASQPLNYRRRGLQEGRGSSKARS